MDGLFKHAATCRDQVINMKRKYALESSLFVPDEQQESS